MGEIADIFDDKSFRAWLNELPQDTDAEKATARRTMITLATRTALRVAPVYWQWSLTDNARKSELTALPILRTLMISFVAALVPTKEIRDAAAYAADAATAAAAAAAADASYAATAASYAAAAAYIATTATAADAATAAVVIWQEVRTDCALLHSGQDPFDHPLWSQPDAEMEMVWKAVKSALINDTRNALAGQDWSFWTRWYESHLAGEQMNIDMLTKIALIEPEVWEQGPAVVNPVIREIELEFAVKATPNAEDIIINDDGLIEAIPRSDLPARTLSDAQNRMRDVFSQIRSVQDQNQYSALSAEADLLDDVLERYPDNALRLTEACSKVVRHVVTKTQNGLLPERDDVVSDVVGDLQNTSDDIYNFDPQVKQTLDARAKLRFARLSPEEQANVGMLGEAVAQNSVPALAQELREDVQEMADADVPEEDKTTVRYRLASRLVRVYALGGKMVKDVSDALILVGGLGGGVGVVWKIIHLIL